MCIKVFLAYLSLLFFDCSGQQTLNMRPFPTAAVTEKGSVTFTCTYSSNSICPPVALFLWFLNGNQTLLLVWRNNSCSFGEGNEALLYTCGIAQNMCEITLTLTQVQRSQHGDVWECRIDNMQKSSSIVVNVPITSVDVTSPSTSPVTVTDNSNITFVCETSAGRPPATITWYKQLLTNAAVLVQGGTIRTIQISTAGITRSKLQYTPTRSDHDYRVYCTAYNIDVSSTFTSNNKPQLYVQFAPDSGPYFQGQINGSTFYILDGKPQSLTCLIKGGHPLASLSWNCFGSTVRDQSTATTTQQQVTWTAARAQGGRRCTCLASHPVWTNTRQVYVTIESLYPPTSPTITVQSQPVTSTVSVIEANSVSVTCSSTSNPPPEYSWNPRGSSSNSDILTLTSVSISDNGVIYTCTVTNTMTPTVGDPESGSSSVSITLDVLFPPTINKLTNDTAEETATFSKTCSVTPGNPTNTEIKWIRVNDNTVFNGQTLTIGNITRDSAGIYRCMVRNTMQPTGDSAIDGTDSATFVLIVHYSASITDFIINGERGNGPFTYNENIAINLTCVVDSNPGSAIYITRDGSVIGKVENNVNSTHTVNEASCLDAGMYSCSAMNQYNGYNVSTISRQVFITCPPRPFDSVNNYTYYYALNENVALNLTVTAYPEPTFRWYKQDKEITRGVSQIYMGVSRNVHQTKLTLVQITQDDLGQYRVVVTNNLGTLEHLFFLVTKGPPAMPVGFMLIRTLQLPTFVWEKGSIDGSNQTFVIEVFKKGNGKWTYALNLSEWETKNRLPHDMFIAEIRGLDPGFYSARIMSKNMFGTSNASELVSPFLVTLSDTSRYSQENAEQPPAAIVIAGVTAGIAAISILLNVIICMKYRQVLVKDGGRGKQNDNGEPQLELRQSSGSPYDNIGSDSASSTGHIDESRNVYERLDPALKKDGIYETMETKKDEMKLDKEEYVNLNL